AVLRFVFALLGHFFQPQNRQMARIDNLEVLQTGTASRGELCGVRPAARGAADARRLSALRLTFLFFWLPLLLIAVAIATNARAERIKDLASIQGVRPNQLIGYGLVVGLDGSGDQTTQTPFTTQSLQAMLTQLGITLPAGTTLQLKNVAAVMV